MCTEPILCVSSEQQAVVAVAVEKGLILYEMVYQALSI